MVGISRELARYFLAAPLALLVALGLSCGDSVVVSPDEAEYRFEGALVIDPNLDSTPLSKSFKVVIRLERDDDISSNAEITFSVDTVVDTFTFEDCRHGLCSVYCLESNSTYAYTSSSPSIRVDDETGFSDTITSFAPDSLTITNVSPPNRQIEGVGQASLEWTASAGAETYVLAAVLADSAYNRYGYSLHATELTTSGTIPPDAFSLSPGPDPDTGLYNLYVYAITGSPDTAVANALLPVPLPVQLADNVAHPNLAGRFGAVVVTLLDTVRVVQQ